MVATRRWDPDPVFFQLSMEAVFALLLYGEVRSQGIQGRVAVAQVVRNRVLRTAKAKGQVVPSQQTWMAVMLKPWAFSCFDNDGGSDNYKAVTELAHLFKEEQPPKSLSLDEIAYIVHGTQLNVLRDPTRGATHYHVTRTLPPTWAKDRRAIYTDAVHSFYLLDESRFD